MELSLVRCKLLLLLLLLWLSLPFPHPPRECQTPLVAGTASATVTTVVSANPSLPRAPLGLALKTKLGGAPAPA
jgi:hypothetical protein